MKEVVAVDLGGTYMRFALIKNGKVEFYNSKDTPKTKDKILVAIMRVGFHDMPDDWHVANGYERLRLIFCFFAQAHALAAA